MHVNRSNISKEISIPCSIFLFYPPGANILTNFKCNFCLYLIKSQESFLLLVLKMTITECLSTPYNRHIEIKSRLCFFTDSRLLFTKFNLNWLSSFGMKARQTDTFVFIILVRINKKGYNTLSKFVPWILLLNFEVCNNIGIRLSD